jgi:hypothetical protein
MVARRIKMEMRNVAFCPTFDVATLPKLKREGTNS